MLCRNPHLSVDRVRTAFSFCPLYCRRISRSTPSCTFSLYIACPAKACYDLSRHTPTKTANMRLLSQKQVLLLCGFWLVTTIIILSTVASVPSLKATLRNWVMTNYQRIRNKSVVLGTLPPFFREFYETELALPQHDESLPYPEGRNGRFLWINNQSGGVSKLFAMSQQ